jgi:hypothetical protein
MDIFALIESKAHNGAFGMNAKSLPTLAQIKAGNYAKGKFSLHGLPIVIEQPRNSIRTGKSKDGKEWQSRMAAHYGYIQGSSGADGDQIDVFIGAVPENTMAYVINQNNQQGDFDEHKVMIGFNDAQDAKRAYLESYERNWTGFGNMLPVTIEQLKWWLKNGNTKVAITPNLLPYDGNNDMNAFDSIPVAKHLYDLRCNDAENLLLDSATPESILDDSDGILALDAMVIPYATMEKKVAQLQRIMEGAAGDVKPIASQVTQPFKKNGTVNVAAIFEMDDGQTVSILFHNPDTTPNKLTPQDEMVSWKWMLNKKDVTIVVAPEKGKDLNPREVATRIMKLVQANSARFAKANATKAARMANIEAMKSQIEAKTAELAQLEAEIEKRKAGGGSAVEGGEQPQAGSVDSIIATMPTKVTDTPMVYESEQEKHDQFVVMRATRPLVGTETMEAPRLSGGGFWSLIDKSNEFAAGNAETNRKLDATIYVAVANSEELNKVALYFQRDNKYFAQYAKAISNEYFNDGLVEQLHNISFGKGDIPYSEMMDAIAWAKAYKFSDSTTQPQSQDYTIVAEDEENAEVEAIIKKHENEIIAAYKTKSYANVTEGTKIYYQLNGYNEFAIGVETNSSKSAIAVTGANSDYEFKEALPASIVDVLGKADADRVKAIAAQLKVDVAEKEASGYWKDRPFNKIKAITLLWSEGANSEANTNKPFASLDELDAWYKSNFKQDELSLGYTKTRVSITLVNQDGQELTITPRIDVGMGDFNPFKQTVAEYLEKDMGYNSDTPRNMANGSNLYVDLTGGSSGGNEEQDSQAEIAKVDAAYKFDASNDFKEWVAQSVSKDDYSPFLSAKTIDEAVKAKGGTVQWGFFGGKVAMDSVTAVLNKMRNRWVFDAAEDEGKEYVGKIMHQGKVIGRVDIGDDGKSMIFVGEEGGQRIDFDGYSMYSNWDSTLKGYVNSLFAGVGQQSKDPNDIESYVQDAVNYAIETAKQFGAIKYKDKVADAENFFRGSITEKVVPFWSYIDNMTKNDERNYIADSNGKAVKLQEAIGNEATKRINKMAGSKKRSGQWDYEKIVEKFSGIEQPTATPEPTPQPTTVDAGVLNEALAQFPELASYKPSQIHMVDGELNTVSEYDIPSELSDKIEAYFKGGAEQQQEDTGMTEAKDFLQSVIDGKVDFMDTEFADKLMAVGEKYPELNDMFEKAAQAYSDWAVKEAQAALAAM